MDETKQKKNKLIEDMDKWNYIHGFDFVLNKKYWMMKYVYKDQQEHIRDFTYILGDMIGRNDEESERAVYLSRTENKVYNDKRYKRYIEELKIRNQRLSEKWWHPRITNRQRATFINCFL